LFLSATRARIYLTRNIRLFVFNDRELRLELGIFKNNPRSPSADIIAPVFQDVR
jgi:hypothetical protein